MQSTIGNSTKKGARRSERHLSRRLRPSERRINKARGGNVNDFGFVVTGLAQVVRLRSRLGTLTRLMAVLSQLALAKFLGHFFTPHFYAKAVYNEKGARRSERPSASSKVQVTNIFSLSTLWSQHPKCRQPCRN